MVGPGLMLWAPESRTVSPDINPLAEGFCFAYPQRRGGSFIWRRWLYVLWDEVGNWSIPDVLTVLT